MQRLGPWGAAREVHHETRQAINWDPYTCLPVPTQDDDDGRVTYINSVGFQTFLVGNMLV